MELEPMTHIAMVFTHDLLTAGDQNNGVCNVQCIGDGTLVTIRL